ncbi:probable F-actin-capping protein subunit beta [Tanacetum coccineum]
MEGAMGLMRRMPPKHTQTALSALLSLLPDHSSDLLSQIDHPLQLVDYGIRNADVISVLLEICIMFVFGLLNCDLGEVAIFSLLGNIWNYISRAARHNNASSNAAVSPWSNKFHPHLDDGMYPSEELRKLEVEANEVFLRYICEPVSPLLHLVLNFNILCWLKQLIWENDGSKYAHGKRGYLHEGGWEAIHVIQVGPDEEGMAHYCLTSTIMLSLTTDSDTSGTFNLSGSIRRQLAYTFTCLDLSVEVGICATWGNDLKNSRKVRNQLEHVFAFRHCVNVYLTALSSCSVSYSKYVTFNLANFRLYFERSKEMYALAVPTPWNCYLMTFLTVKSENYI